jgi:hypothetical protein
MVELRLRELRDLYAARNLNEVVEGIDLALDAITAKDLKIDSAQVLPKNTILASLTECYIKSYPDITHPWKSSSGRVLSDSAMDWYIDSREVALYRYGTGLDHSGEPI